MTSKIAVLPGDGIGPEVIQEALKVLRRLSTVFKHDFHMEEGLAGGAALDAVGVIEMKMAHQSALDFEVLFFGRFQDRVHLPGGVHHQNLARVLIADEINKILHRPDFHLF